MAMVFWLNTKMDTQLKQNGIMDNNKARHINLDPKITHLLELIKTIIYFMVLKSNQVFINSKDISY